MARRRKRTAAQSDKAVAEFRGRMEFLEQMWGATTEYEVDLSTGRAWFRITPKGSTVTLSVHGVDVGDVLLPAANG